MHPFLPAFVAPDSRSSVAVIPPFPFSALFHRISVATDLHADATLLRPLKPVAALEQLGCEETLPSLVSGRGGVQIFTEHIIGPQVAVEASAVAAIVLAPPLKVGAAEIGSRTSRQRVSGEGNAAQGDAIPVN
jgi:hypothetical protein